MKKTNYQTWFWMNGIHLAGDINNFKEMVVELRRVAKWAGADLSNYICDFCFEVEAEYQKFYNLDENDFEIVKFED